IEADEEEQIDLLFSHVDSLPEAGRFKVTIPAAPGRKARSSELAIRFSPVTLRKPLHGAPGLHDTVTLAVVDVRETSTPEGGKPIHWRLLTTHPVVKIADARRTV